MSPSIRQRVEPGVSVEYGEYLAKSVANCYGCHTNRDLKTGEFTGEPMAGGLELPHRGKVFTIPNITPAVLDWTEEDIVAYLSSGFTPDFNVAGGSMTAVIRNTQKLSRGDLEAIAAYLKAVPPVPNAE